METRPSHEVRMKVAFYDLDPLQIVWHGNYLKYFDVARGELFDHLGLDLFEFHARTGYIFPIIRTAVKHVHPLTQGDEFVCRATVKEARTKIVIAFEVHTLKEGRLCAKGSTEQVAVRTPGMEMAFLIPEEISRILGG
jgi:acyl-CoA thioester hydrolase